jgi:hypothetical protein
MEKFEMIERLSARANVSFADARDALEASDWDMLDALILLEKQGKTGSEQIAREYTTQKKESFWQVGQDKADAAGKAAKVWERIKAVLHKGNINQFVITRKGEELIAMPITVMVLLMICFWPFSMIVMFAGLFLKARYSFRGPDISERVNHVMGSAQDKAASAVESRLGKTEAEEEDDQ